MFIRNVTAFAWAFVWLASADAALPAGTSSLFVDVEPLPVTLSFDPQALCRAKGEPDCHDLPAVLSYREPDGTVARIEVELRARGGWRLDKTHCAIPPLFIVFAGKGGGGGHDTGLFAGQRFLPLTTHCQPRPTRYEQYVVKEYLAYRLYGLFSDASLRARLLHVTYANPRTGKNVVRYAFLTEHFDWLAARYGATVSRPKSFDPLTADATEMATLDLFQYLVGNTDWSVAIPHNVIFLNKPDGSVTAVPYDFDFAGLVDTSYASPAEGLPIDNVRRRLYRGFCLPGIDWDELFTTFQGRRDAAMMLIETTPGLSTYSRKRARIYLDRFYETIRSARLRKKRILGACRALPPTEPGRID